MTTGYSISIHDWQDEKWNFVGRHIEENAKGEWSEDNQDGVGTDDHYPMMNYAYPLCECPDDKTIRKIHKKTNCTVVEDTETGDVFLALCGGGMDLSQDVAMAYIIAEDVIPADLAYNVSRQEGLSQHRKDWLKVMRYCRKALISEAECCKNTAKRIQEAMKEYRERENRG